MELAFGYPRNFLENRYVYVVLSPRARGLSVGLNLTPSRTCNFDCVYCEVNRAMPVRADHLEVEVMAGELERTLAFIQSGQIRRLACFASTPDELLQLRHVALSGDGEPTLCPKFAQVVRDVVHLRALGSLLRDVAVLSARGHRRTLANVDLGPSLEELARSYGRDRAVRAFAAVDRALGALERNASPKIVVDWLALHV